ncbi:hypothetical protein PG994_001645 [Apiospora phragmitis]|uniref:Uncharacterized protein n=1 Tax=Apiospora phragmitis TaxID=2905665 RepID=A0ABR1WU41_9PEZI
MNSTAVESLCSSTTLVASQNIASSAASTTTTTTTTITTTSPSPPTPTISSTTTIITNETSWQRRDVACLKTQEELETECQEVVLGQDLYGGATGHPCIIMDLAPDGRHALVTTVSSFRSGPHNGYLPPWKHHWHQGKEPDRFRSFAGTERYGYGPTGRDFLHLEGGRRFPKSRTAWIYAGWVHLVPVRALRHFNAAERGLRLEMQSWIDLYGHQCAMTPMNIDLFNDAKLTPSIYHPKSPQIPLAGSSATTTTGTPESHLGSSPPSASASPSSPHHHHHHQQQQQQQSPQLANNGSPKPQHIVPAAPVSYVSYGNVAGNFTNRQIYQQTYRQTYQMVNIPQLHQQQIAPTWAQYPQTQQVCSPYQHQYQRAPAIHAGQCQQQHHTGSYMAGAGQYYIHSPYLGY